MKITILGGDNNNSAICHVNGKCEQSYFSFEIISHCINVGVQSSRLEPK